MQKTYLSARSVLNGFAIVALFACAHAMVTTPARAEDYPLRAVRIIVPTGPGGGYDVFARIIGDQLAQRTKQGFIVENRTGAGTIVGTQAAINATPDGYTLLAGGLSNIIFNASLYEKAPYDALTQLVPVAIVYKNSYILITSNDVPYTNVKDFIAAAKAKPNGFNVATAGVGTGQQLVAVAFMQATGTQMSQVPYKGATAVYPDLLAGRVDAFFDSTTGALPYVKGGKAKALAILSAQRSKDAPDVPTMAEAGISGLAVDAWLGLFAPAGTPKPVIEKLRKVIAEAMPQMEAKFATVGGETMSVPADKLDGFIRADNDMWTKLIKEAGIKLSN
ncbi:MAG: transporter substrate-binding protein [Rhizobium sp.]|nr:transporter substrate-binding protein [Rhizobium sp.]